MGSVTLDKIQKVFGSKKQTATAVESLDLQIDEAEFVTLVGPSGCGKTTTLRMIAGLEEPTSGRVLFDDKDVTNVPVQKRALSMVFQNYAIFPHMTVAQNVGYGLKVAKVPARERAQKVQVAADMVGIGDLLHRFPRQLSGGQRQRVALARALARDPKTVLMDEPLSNLDAKMRDQTRAEIKRLHRNLGSTIVYVTHDQLEAITLSDKIAVMAAGRLQQYGPPAEVFHRPANLFVAGFIGAPKMNFFGGHLTTVNGSPVVQTPEGLTLPVSEADAAAAPHRDVTFGLRPQYVRFGAAAGFEWQVTVVEPLGTEAIVHLERDGVEALAMAPESITVNEGETVRVEMPAEKAILFDTDTGQAIYASESIPTPPREMTALHAD